MPFHLTSDQDLVRKTVRELVESVRGKVAEEIDRERRWPGEEMKTLAGLGLTGMLVPPEHGGPGTDAVTFVCALEEVARASGTVALVLNNANALGTFAVATFGSDEARAAVLPPALAGESFIAWGVSEPGAGSDVGGIQTRAARDGDAYVLNGLKSFVVGAEHAGAIVVVARVPETDGLTAFVVPADADGVKVAPAERTMTTRGADMAQVFLKDVRVPASHRLGDEGAADALLDRAGLYASLGSAAISVGLMQAALEDAIEYAGDREQFRMPIKNFQAIQFLVAQLDTEVRAARLLTRAAADRIDLGEDAAADVAAAKLYASESAKHVTQKSLRIHGGTGFMRDIPVERYNRDARSMSVYAGTAEAAKATLAAKALDL